MIAANGDNHRIPGNRRSRDLTADGLRHNDFSGVDNVIARNGINDHPRQERFDIHRMGGAAAVARAVGGAGANLIHRLTQCADRRSRHGNAPVAGTIGGGAVRQAVQHHGDRSACRQTAGTAADGQILGFLRIINNVITGDGVNGQRRAAEINGHIMGSAVAVARAIAQAGGNGLASGCQCRHIPRRNAHTPVTGGVQRGGVVFTVQVNRDHIARRRARAGSADDQRLTVFDGINNVIARNGINGEIRCGNVHRQRMIRACRVTRFVAHRGGHGITAGGQSA